MSVPSAHGESPRADTAGPLERDRLLVEAAQQDPRRFADLYDVHFERIYAYALLRLRNRGDAEDATSETFHRALRGIDAYEWRGLPFAAWLYRIAANVMRDQQRRSNREEAVAEPPEDGSAPSGVEERCMVYDLVGRLPDDQRCVIEMRYGQDRSIRQTAETLGRSEGAIKQLQLRALRSMRAWVTDDE